MSSSLCQASCAGDGTGRLFVNDQEVQLTPREYSLLDFLLQRHDELCSRDEILARVWGINFDTGTNMVDVYIYFLRRKLTAHGFGGEIHTVRGYGYRLDAPQAAGAAGVDG